MKEDELLAKLLFERFQKIALNVNETAQVIGVSKKALESDRYNAIGIPFTKRNNKERAQVMYSITAIAKFIIENQIKTF